MRYVLLIYYNEDDLAAAGSNEQAAEFAEYVEFNSMLDSAGASLAAQALQPTTTATTVRVRSDEALLTDGPFAETKEQLGGFYLIEADDLDHAIELAAHVPSARYGSVEVRPIWDWSDTTS